MIRDERSITLAESPEQARPILAETSIHGSVLVLIQFDVCEEIRLDELRQIFGARTLEQPSFKHPAPGYVRYQRPPVVSPLSRWCWKAASVWKAKSSITITAC